MSARAVLAAVVVLAACHARAPIVPEPGQHEQAFRGRVTRDVGARYLLYLPRGYDRARAERWPLLLFLHGAGERGDTLARVATHGPPKFLASRPDFPFVVVSPQARPDSIWSNLALDALIDDVVARYRLDPDRIYVTGLSMGGYGAWQLAMEFPRRFAALVPVSAGAVPSGACALKHLPIWVFHGARDDIVPLDRAQQLVTRIRACPGASGALRFTVYPDATHDAWTRTYDDPALYEWLLRQRRRPVP